MTTDHRRDAHVVLHDDADGALPEEQFPDEKFPDDRFPAEPYPGTTPDRSFVHLDAVSRPIRPTPSALSGWVVPDGTCLDRWLTQRGAAPLAGRVPVLAYGSNRCPSKITWLREHLGLAGPVVVLRARVHGLAAVWAAGRRARDGACPATLAVLDGATETHAVWMATPEQVAVLDRCEGRGERYDLVRLQVGRVVTDDGVEIDEPWAYWPAGPQRAPLLVDGVPLRCVDVDEAVARRAVGVPAPLPTGVVSLERGAPDPQGWPTRVFAYGTLQPGERAWPLMSAHCQAADGATPAVMPGRVYDTGRGYPALCLPTGTATARATDPARPALEDLGRASGAVVRLTSPPASLPVLDEYEGAEYRRVRRATRLLGGTAGDAATHETDPSADVAPGADRTLLCWVWVWIDDRDAWPVVAERWTSPPQA